MPSPYRDRMHAGDVLVERLGSELLKEDFKKLVVLAVPNGGVAVARPIVKRYDADFDIIIVRKIQVPHNPEAGFGAVASDGNVVLNEEVLAYLGLSEQEIDAMVDRVMEGIRQRLLVYTGSDSPRELNVSNRVALLVDDGLASGATMLAAISVVRKGNPERVVVAAPTAPYRTVMRLSKEVDQIVVPYVAYGDSFAVANAYKKWYDVPDIEVIQILSDLGYAKEHKI